MKKDEKKKSGYGIASLVLGIISILSFFFWYISLPTGILAIILGVKGIKKVGSGFGKTGLILGIVGLSVCVLTYMVMISALIMT